MATSACPRRGQWLEQLSARAARQTAQAGRGDKSGSVQPPTVAQLPAQISGRIEALAAALQAARRALIWIDAADVRTLRSAVALAASVRGTIHVGQSAGAAAAHRVLTSQGWLGSSLAEVASQADLIISLGGGLLTEAPLLAPRFILPALNSGRAQWCHIDAHAPASPQSRPMATAPTSSQPTPDWTALWPRSEWYEQLTSIMLGLQPESACAQSAAGQLHESTGELLDKLRRAKNTVWLWDVDEFRDDIDELCIHRLLGISRLLSHKARCGLLGLDAQVGRVTACEALLWLTGCSGTAQFDGQHWSQPHGLAGMALEDWPTVFDSIVVVRSLPSVQPLPSLQASHFMIPEVSLLPDHVADDTVTVVSSVGVDSAGHVMRGDRATMLYCQGSGAASQPVSTASQLPTAATLLEQILRRVSGGVEIHAN